VIVLERHPAIAPLAAEWDALADRAGAPPFARPGWVAAWAGAFAGDRVEVLAARRDGRLCGVLPVTRRAGALRAAVNVHTPAGDVLAEDGAALRALLGGLYARRPRVLVLTQLDAAGPSRAAARQAALAAGFRVAERTAARAPYLDVDGDYDALARRRRNAATDLRRRRRRLAEHGTVADTLDGTLAELLALEARGWKGARGTAITSRPSTDAFYRSVVDWARDRGGLRLFAYRFDGRALAVLLGLEDHGTLYLLKGGYDPAFAPFSPGRAVLGAAIAHAFRSGLRRIEFGGGTEAYKLVWTRTVTERLEVRGYAPSALGDLAWVAVAQGRPLAERAGLDRVLRPGRDRLLTFYDAHAHHRPGP
jgi:CelD/BcsL family acetyltransferase involved in cellulose biosynthesis